MCLILKTCRRKSQLTISSEEKHNALLFDEGQRNFSISDEEKHFLRLTDKKKVNSLSSGKEKHKSLPKIYCIHLNELLTDESCVFIFQTIY